MACFIFLLHILLAPVSSTDCLAMIHFFFGNVSIKNSMEIMVVFFNCLVFFFQIIGIYLCYLRENGYNK